MKDEAWSEKKQKLKCQRLSVEERASAVRRARTLRRVCVSAKTRIALGKPTTRFW